MYLSGPSGSGFDLPRKVRKSLPDNGVITPLCPVEPSTLRNSSFFAGEKNRAASMASVASSPTISGAKLNDKGLAPPPPASSFTGRFLGSEDSAEPAPESRGPNGSKAIVAPQPAADIVAGASTEAA